MHAPNFSNNKLKYLHSITAPGARRNGASCPERSNWLCLGIPAVGRWLQQQRWTLGNISNKDRQYEYFIQVVKKPWSFTSSDIINFSCVQIARIRWMSASSHKPACARWLAMAWASLKGGSCFWWFCSVLSNADETAIMGKPKLAECNNIFTIQRKEKNTIMQLSYRHWPMPLCGCAHVCVSHFFNTEIYWVSDFCDQYFLISISHVSAHAPVWQRI